ncbi:MAG: hypothetical protein MJA82_09790 [Clostridia bacterium]|nr:hypothetical protein [Clostridia bacterium]
MSKNNNGDKDIKDLREWQSKQYSPGNFIGTGRVPRPLLGLAKFPIILVGIGIFFLFLSLLSAFKKEWPFLIISIIFSIIFLYGGIIRFINRKK